MMSIAFKEGIRIPPPALNEIILASNQDVRQVKKSKRKLITRLRWLCPVVTSLPPYHCGCFLSRWSTISACGQPRTRWWRTTSASPTQPAHARTWSSGRLTSAGRCLPRGRRRPAWASLTSRTSFSTTTRWRRCSSRRTTCTCAQLLQGERGHLLHPVRKIDQDVKLLF